jgi:hypothetical protein
MNFVSFNLDHEQNLLHKYRNYLQQDSIKTFYESLPYPVQNFLMFRHLKMEIIFGKIWCHPGCHNTEHNDIQFNANLQNDIPLNDTHGNSKRQDIQHHDLKSIKILSIVCHCAECRDLFIVMLKLIMP